MNAVPVTWDALLYSLRSIGLTDAIIAGGALRDLDNGRVIKDIDVFATHQMSAHDVAKKLGVEYRPVLQESQVAYVGSASEIGEVGEYHFSGLDLPVQIIFLPLSSYEPGSLTLENAASRFDFGLCRIAYDGKTLQAGTDYQFDKMNGTFTLLRCENDAQFERSMERYTRLSPKYPGYKLVIPPAFKGYADNYQFGRELAA